MFGNGSGADVAAGGIVACRDGIGAEFRHRRDRGGKIGREGQGLVEMDVNHLKRIILSRRVREIDRRGLSARRLRGVVGEARRAELRVQRGRGPRSQPVLHRVWLRRRNPVEVSGHGRLDAHLLRGQARSAPQEFEGVHAWGRVRQRERFGQAGRDDPFGFDIFRRFGP